MIATQRMSVRAVLRDRTIVRRAIVFAAGGLVVIALLANTVFRPTNQLVERVPDARVNAPADAVAQSFTAAYLMVGEGDARSVALKRFGENPAWDLGLATEAKARNVVATQISSVAVRHDNGDRITTVEAQLSDGTVQYLAVRTRTTDGVISIVGAPAIVGAPPIGSAIEGRETNGDEADEAVVDMVQRAMRHLLAGRSADLAPDLAPHAEIALPATALELVEVESLTWVEPPTGGFGTVQARVVADDRSGVRLTLDYELDLVQTDQGRWQLSVVHLPAA